MKLISSIISSLNPNKSVGSNSIPTNLLKLLKDKISSHRPDIYNISFSMGVFQSVYSKLPKPFCK